MNRRIKSAVITARALLSQGILGSDLHIGIREAHPTLSEKEWDTVRSSLRREIGLLGRVAHDPNQYTSCRKAAEAKERHATPQTLILTYKTPMCSSCRFNRKGSCGLMGGKLIKGPNHVPEEAVSKTARLLVEEGLLDSKDAGSIEASNLPPAKRAAALHLRTTLPLLDEKERIKAQAESIRMSSIMAKASKGVDIQPVSLTGPAEALNRDTSELDGVYSAHEGDSLVARKASRAAAILRPAEMKVDLPGKQPGLNHSARLPSRSTFDVPKPIKGSRRMGDLEEESLRTVQKQYDRLTHLSSRLLAKGMVTADIATKLASRMDTLEQSGARSSRRASRITNQLAALTGAHLEW